MNKAVALVIACCCAIGMTSAMSLGYKANMRLRPFAMMPVPNYYVLDGATVSIEAGYVQGHDKLYFDYQGDFPIEHSFNAKTGVLSLWGAASISEYTTAISQVVFVTTSEKGQHRRLTWSFGKDTVKNTLTGHYYRYYQIIGSWGDALQNCNASSFFGAKGYLASVSSQDEQNGIGSKAPFSAWVGLADPSKTNTWTWQAGPEAGTTVWKGLSLYRGGVPQGERTFTSWNRFQPQPSMGTSDNFVAVIPSAYEAVANWENHANTFGVQGYVCEYGDNLAAATTASGLAVYSGSVVAYLDCKKFDSSSDCQNNAGFGCAWSGGACQTTKCIQFEDEKTCAESPLCSWNTESEMGKCVNTACSQYTNADLCNSDPKCVIKKISGIDQCVDAKCRDQSAACNCAAMEGCSFRAARCGFDQAINCNGMDIVYLLDGSSEMAMPFGKHPQGFEGLTELFINSQMMLTNTPAGSTLGLSVAYGQRVGFVQYGSSALTTAGANTGSNGRLTGSWTQMVEDLQWHQSAFGNGASVRNVGDALQAASQMFADSGSRTRVIVVVASGHIDDAFIHSQLYAANHMADTPLGNAMNNATVVGVALRRAEPASYASMQAWASLKDIAGTKLIGDTMSWFTQDAIYGLCNTMSTLGKLTNPGNNAALCSAESMATCKGRAHCAWSFSAKQCVTSHCLAHCTSSGCSADSTCAWTGNECVESCPSKTTQNDCDAAGAASCSWTGSACVAAPCVSNPTEDACIADTSAKCQYTASAAVKCQVMPCQYSNSTQCALTAGCSWATSSCFWDVCKQQTTVSGCEAFPKQCMWKDGGCAVQECTLLRDEKSCDYNRKCAWDMTLSPAACTPALCTGLNLDPTTAESACKLNPKCAWDPNADLRCSVKTCEKNTRACDCAAQSGCVWRNEQCKDNRYVQCPMIDVVFVVEATSYMNNAFGRHPNGFIGIVETIREWSRDAPFSGLINQTGFRMAMVGYGADNTALVTPDGIGGGGTTVVGGTGDKWFGVGQELDEMEKKQTAYASSIGTEVAIKPALQKALAILKSTPKTAGRNQMVVVLGASSITDGTSNIAPVIGDIEAYGAKIFTNVIRRFSAITVGEQMSSMFLRPIGSNPPSIHFRFSTIDQMRQSLLDKFCDPSTGTGEVLQVSRDRTLPCNWLVGQTECNMQASCQWNASALKTCPSAGQCPNLDCMALPDAVASKFKCHHCKLVSGAFQCSLSNNFNTPAGLCQTAACAHDCGCSDTTNCRPNTEKKRCDREMCTATTPLAQCNADYGCVYYNVQASQAECRRSQCWNLRSQNSCDGLIVNNVAACRWRKDMFPAICEERRCNNFNQATCALDTAQCGYSNLRNPPCYVNTCPYTTGEKCELDDKCYWNPFDSVKGVCSERSPNCVLSFFSGWSPCTTSCGKGVETKSRKIVQFPSDKPFAKTCSKVAEEPCRPDDTFCKNGDGLVVNKQCNNTGARSSCTSWCSGYGSNVRGCTDDISCYWKDASCQPVPFSGCNSLDKAGCDASDMCEWDTDYSYCNAVVKACQYSTQDQCNKISKCYWRTGAVANQAATSMKLPIQLVNPGQAPIFPFPNLQIPSETVIWGASVVIETNYQRGKDILSLSYPSKIKTKWLAQSGTLKMWGTATMDEYSSAIRFTQFETTSTNRNHRTITWSFGNSTIYSSKTKHHYTSAQWAGVSWAQADAACSAMNMWGLKGYLATVDSPDENAMVSSKLAGDGWLGGSDSAGTSGQWKWTTGPDAGKAFWVGQSADAGGYELPNMYANWDVLDGQPAKMGTPGMSNVYLNLSGYWSAKPGSSQNTVGFVCEFGGSASDATPPVPLGGAMVVGIAGCIPNTCLWHSNETHCKQDVECAWTGTQCAPGCGSRSTIGECISSQRCMWDTKVLPPMCDTNPCYQLGATACGASPKCVWNPTTKCVAKTGCAAYETSADCNLQPSCAWETGSGCSTKKCKNLLTSTDCNANAICYWENNRCQTSLCKYTTSSRCTVDRQCRWNPGAASDSVGFTTGGSSVYPFANYGGVPADSNTLVDGITIAVVTGFVPNEDMLGVPDTSEVKALFTKTWDAAAGVLRLAYKKGASLDALTTFRWMQKNVWFRSVSNKNVQRTISYVLGNNMAFSNTNQMLIKWYPSEKKTTRAEANAFCATNDFFGVSGSLAVVNNELDNIFLSNIGAKGWLGAWGAVSTADASKDNWVWPPTGQKQAQTFWVLKNGIGEPVDNGKGGVLFAQWDGDMPRRAAAGQTLGAFMTNDGMWLSVADGSSAIQSGIICQYNTSNIVTSGSFKANPQGCFVAPCITLLENDCRRDTQCNWVPTLTGGSCQVDSWCSTQPTPGDCTKKELCYWDYDVNLCLSTPATVCSALPQVNCSATNAAGVKKYKQCAWNPFKTNKATRTDGVCSFMGCADHPKATACKADPTCRWVAESNQCIARVCGFPSEDACWRDPKCQFDRNSGTCEVNTCAKLSATECAQSATYPMCSFDSTTSTCKFERCSSRYNTQVDSQRQECLSDSSCLVVDGKCEQPQCSKYKLQADCNKDPKCYFNIKQSGSTCQAAQCVVHTTLATCEQGETLLGKKPCIWEGGSCRQPTWRESGAAGDIPGECSKEIEPSLWWLWLLVAIIFILLILICWRLYLAYAKNLNFFDPNRKNTQFDLSKYKDLMQEDAQERAVETNQTKSGTANRPEFSDL